MDPIARMVAAGAAGASGSSATYVDDVFSTFLYDGTSSTQTINNGIDLSGEGGLVWFKNRETGVGVALGHVLQDTERGNTKFLRTQGNGQEETSASMISSFNSNGFTFGSDTNINYNGDKGVAWTFRKAKGFFDVVTYTGSGSPQTISHNLDSVPGMIIVKCTSDGSTDWTVYHREAGHPAYGAGSYALFLNTTGAEDPSAAYWDNTDPTSTVFTVGVGDKTNGNGKTYVAYLFAHDDARFGTNEDESIIKCGSITTPSSGDFTVDLGFEPQWLMFKKSSSAGGSWVMRDVMRGWSTNGFYRLFAESSQAEDPSWANSTYFPIENNGFSSSTDWLSANSEYIYMAIRRPNKPAEDATDVFAVDSFTGSTPNYISDFVVDFAINRNQINVAGNDNYVASRLQGEKFLKSNTEGTEIGASAATFDFMNGWSSDSGSASSEKYAWMFKRAPGFLDVVSYTGSGSPSGSTISHNLGVVPELLITKRRDNGNAPWAVYSSVTGNGNYLRLNTNDQSTSTNFWQSTTPTSTQFYVNSNNAVGNDANNYVAYLFASLEGVSKVGSYTGTGSAINVDCGFTAGARFVLIKRTDSTSHWFVFDTLRGITSSSSPWIALNSDLDQQTGSGNNFIDPYNAGFTVDTSISALNANGGTYLFLAIA